MIDSALEHDATFGTITWKEFKQQAAEFFLECETSTREQIDNGFKALTILYFGLDAHPDSREGHEAAMLMEIAGRK